MLDYLEDIIFRLLNKIKFLLKIRIDNEVVKALTETKHLKFKKGRCCVITTYSLEPLETLLELILVFVSVPILLVTLIVNILYLIPKIAIVKKNRGDYLKYDKS